MINMEAIPKFDTKSVIKSDISTKPTTRIGHKCQNIFKMYVNSFFNLMPYPCSRFCADIKFDIRFDNRFGIRLVDSFHVNHTINFVTKSMIYGIV